MIVIENNEVYSTEGKPVKDLKTGAIIGHSQVLPDAKVEDYEELDEKPAYTKEQYDAKVSELIRERYSQDEENAIKSKVLASILPNTLSEETNAKHMEQFAEFNAYREECKERAKDPELYKPLTPEA